MAKKDLAVRQEGGALSTKFAGALKGMRREKLTMPRLSVAQPTSAIVKDLDLAKIGEFFNSLTNANYGKELIFTVITGAFSRTKWIPQDDGGGIECSARDGETGNVYGACMRCKFTKWGHNDKTNKDTPPPCTENDNFLVLVRGEGTPMTLTFCKSSAKAGNKLRTILVAEETLGHAPWAQSYKLTSQVVKYAKGSCAVMSVALAGTPTKEEMSLAEKWFTTTQERGIDLGEAAEQAGAAEPDEETEASPAPARNASAGARVAQKGGVRRR